MNYELILVNESYIAALLSLGFLVFSLWRKEVLLSDAVWNKLVDQMRSVRFILSAGLLSLIVFFIAEFSEVSGTSSSIHEIGEGIHMFLILVAFGAIIHLSRSILGDE